MSTDLYEALGVKKDATDAEIKKAYRKIVKTSHPDLHPDDPGAEARFKAAAAAYDILKDPEQRARYDRGEIDASGQETPQHHFYKQYAGQQGNPYQGGPGGAQGFEGFEDIDMSSFFDEYLRGRAGGGGFGGGFGGGGFGGAGGGEFHAHGADRHYRLEIPFMDAVKGAVTRLTLPDGQSLEVRIPQGLRDGQTIRLRGKGSPGIGKGKPGDALITVHVAPHPVFTREGNDIRVTLPITIDEAILGGKVPVPTIDGTVKVNVPKGASCGQVLRLKGRGVAPRKGRKGDQLVELKIVSPPEIDKELEDFMTEWRKSHSHDPRKGMKT